MVGLGLLMSRDEAFFWGAGVAILLGLYIITKDDEGNMFDALKDFLAGLDPSRGKRLTRSTLDAKGDCLQSPAQLADEAGETIGNAVSLDSYALARMLASEEPTASPATKVAIGWVAFNEAVRRGVSIVQLLTSDTNEHGKGKFGTQAGRYASTRTDPHEQELSIAETILSGSVPDPTDGAIHFYRPTLQDKLFRLGKVRSTADDIDEAWGGDGYAVMDVDPDIKFYKQT